MVEIASAAILSGIWQACSVCTSRIGLRKELWPCRWPHGRRCSLDHARAPNFAVSGIAIPGCGRKHAVAIKDAEPLA